MEVFLSLVSHILWAAANAATQFERMSGMRLFSPARFDAQPVERHCQATQIKTTVRDFTSACKLQCLMWKQSGKWQGLEWLERNWWTALRSCTCLSSLYYAMWLPCVSVLQCRHNKREQFKNTVTDFHVKYVETICWQRISCTPNLSNLM